MTPPEHTISPEGLPTSTRQRVNFRWKLTLLNSGLITLIAFFFFLYIPNHLKRQALEAIEEKAGAVAEMSTFSLAPALALGRYDEVEKALEETVRLEDVAYVLVLSPEDQPMVSIIRDSTLDPAHLSIHPHESLTSDGRLYEMHRTIDWGGETLGRLHLGFSLEELNRSLTHSRLTIALVSFLVFLFGIMATLCISAFITRPLKRIVQAAEAIAEGNLKQRAPVQTRDEIGQLAASFNDMVDSLNEAYEALRDSESRFRALSEHASDMTLIIDRKAKIAYVSPVCQTILGYSMTDLVGRRALNILHPDDRRRALRALAHERTDGSKIITLEARVQHQSGSWRTISFRARNLIDHPGINGILVNARDVTENRKFERELVLAKEQAEEMVRLKDAFLTNMSHEIRTPLTGILGFAQILLSEVDDDYRPLVASIEQSGQRLLHTLNSVLDLAQLEAASVHLKLQPLNVYEESLAAVRLLQPLASKKGLTLDVRSTAEEPVARLDRAYLNRILNNLVGNGIKFTEEGGVLVKISVEHDRLLIEVQDSGVGIDEAFLPDIFSEFKQESSGIGREYEGNGLGLTITKRLVEMMNGTIAVKSIKGLGSVFTVTFPVYRPPATSLKRPPKQEPAAPRPALPRKVRTASLLAVDDNPDVRMLLERWLGSGLSVTTVKDSATAFEEAKKSSFDVVLMDISLREERDGVSVMRDLRTQPGFEKTLFVALTAFALPGDRERFLEEGFDAYLSKPFTRQNLTSLLDELLHRKSASGSPQTVP